jgi:hypothetical protein
MKGWQYVNIAFGMFWVCQDVKQEVGGCQDSQTNPWSWKKTCIYDKILYEYKDTQKKDVIWKQIASRLWGGGTPRIFPGPSKDREPSNRVSFFASGAYERRREAKCLRYLIRKGIKEGMRFNGHSITSVLRNALHLRSALHDNARNNAPSGHGPLYAHYQFIL